MTSLELLQEIDAWLSFNNSPSKEQISELRNDIKKHISEQLNILHVSKSLLIKKYEIDFGGNVLAGLEITNNEPTVIGATNGWGNGISKDEITITEK